MDGVKGIGGLFDGRGASSEREKGDGRERVLRRKGSSACSERKGREHEIMRGSAVNARKVGDAAYFRREVSPLP